MTATLEYDLITAGYWARENEEGRAPACNRTVIDALDALEDKAVGNPQALEIMRAFYKGWAKHEAEELKALGF